MNIYENLKQLAQQQEQQEQQREQHQLKLLEKQRLCVCAGVGVYLAMRVHVRGCLRVRVRASVRAHL